MFNPTPDLTASHLLSGFPLAIEAVTDDRLHVADKYARGFRPLPHLTTVDRVWLVPAVEVSLVHDRMPTPNHFVDLAAQSLQVRLPHRVIDDMRKTIKPIEFVDGAKRLIRLRGKMMFHFG